MLTGPEEGVRSSGAGVTDGCDLPTMGAENNTGPLEEQQAFLTAEPSLQPTHCLILNGVSQ